MWDVFVKETAFVESRVIGSFSHSEPDEIEILTKGNMNIYELRKQQSKRSLSWLQNHGTCGDNIRAKTSGLPQAGRGAFAARNMPNGTFVAQLPMIHIADRSVLEMYNFANVVAKGIPVFLPRLHAGSMGYQLLLNYCYGHNQSSLLLCPYGPLTNFINHNQSLANVRLSWGRPESGNHEPSFLQQPIESFGHEKTAKLALELVATRYIEEGEEIFLDYGDEWEAAWQEHLRNWNPVDGADFYKSAADFNAELSKRLPTVFEQLNRSAEPFPPNVELRCDHFLTQVWREHYKQDTWEKLLQFHYPDYWQCEILRVHEEDGNYFYTIHMYKYEKTTAHTPSQNDIAYGVPQNALRFFDLPYTYDYFLPNTFRHDIRIPDDIFPQKWRNLKS